MNNYKSVRNRLFKNSEVELKSEKVQLSVIDDLNNALSTSSKTIAELNENLKQINSLNSDIDKGLKKSEKSRADVQKTADKFFKLEDQFLNAKRIYNEAIETNKKELDFVDRDRDLLNKEKKNSVKTLQSTEKLQAVFNRNITKAEKAAKELGLKLPIDKYKKAVDKLNELEQRISIASDKHRS